MGFPLENLVRGQPKGEMAIGEQGEINYTAEERHDPLTGRQAGLLCFYNYS